MKRRPLKFLKLGGSLLSDKSMARSLRVRALREASAAIARAMRRGEFQLLIGHGGGAFGHSVAEEYDVVRGLPAGRGWSGFHATREAMLDLDARVVEALRSSGVEAVPIQPSSCCTARNGALATIDASAVKSALRAGAVPVVFGDAVLDTVRGFTILSTEVLFKGLAQKLRPSAVIELSDVPGICSGPVSPPAAGRAAALRMKAMPSFARADLKSFRPEPGPGADVTGGIASKARLLVELAESLPRAEVRLLCGLDTEAVESALLGKCRCGTLFRAR